MFMDNTEDDLDFSIRDGGGGKETKTVAMEDDDDEKHMTTKQKKTSDMIHQTLKNTTLSLAPPTPDQLNQVMDKAKEEYCKRATQWIPENQKQFKENARPLHSKALIEDERREIGAIDLKKNRMTEPVFSRAADKRQQQSNKKKLLLIDSDDDGDNDDKMQTQTQSQQQQSYKSTSSSSSSNSMSLI
jgi:hypothetical protein